MKLYTLIISIKNQNICEIDENIYIISQNLTYFGAIFKFLTEKKIYVYFFLTNI